VPSTTNPPQPISTTSEWVNCLRSTNETLPIPTLYPEVSRVPNVIKLMIYDRLLQVVSMIQGHQGDTELAVARQPMVQTEPNTVVSHATMTMMDKPVQRAWRAQRKLMKQVTAVGGLIQVWMSRCLWSNLQLYAGWSR